MDYGATNLSTSFSERNSLKRLELPISKFNDVAIPHHLDLLKRHKSNIIKYKSRKDWDQVYKEQINASRILKQLKQLLYELDMLRKQVGQENITTFDKLTSESRTSTLEAIQEYSELELQLPLLRFASTKETIEPEHGEVDVELKQLYDEQEDLQRQKDCLHAWNALQNDLEQLYQLFTEFNKVVQEQCSHVENIEMNVENVQANVEAGTMSLKKAAEYKVATLPLSWGLIGMCMGGPVGFFAGMKIGGLVALSGGFLGFVSGKFLKNNAKKTEEAKKTD